MLDIFKKKQNTKEFLFIGNRQHLRTEDELLLSNGFYKYKTNAYVRLNSIGLLEYIDLQKERYGSKTFCVNFAVMPLYCESKYIDISLGHRLGTFISGKDVWWDYASENVAKESFTNVSTAIGKYVLPWFEQVSTEDGYRAKLLNLHNKKLAKEWIDAMENVEDKETLIQQSVVELKLPKKIQR